MIYGLIVPETVEDVSEMRVLEWHCKPGDVFAPGDLMVELETHKVVVEVRAGASAIMREILCEVGDWRRLGAPLAILSEREDEALPDTADGLPRPIVALAIV